MNWTPSDIALFAEDPGAANCIAGLPSRLEDLGWRVTTFTDGLAQDWLADRGLMSLPLSRETNLDEVLSAIDPSLVLIGTAADPETVGLGLIDAARAKGIPTIGLIDGRMSAALRFRGGSQDSMRYAPDWLLVPDEWTKESYAALGYQLERIKVCGHPNYEYVANVRAGLELVDREMLRKRLFPKLGDDQKVVVFATEGSDRARVASRGSVTNPRRTEEVLDKFLTAVNQLDSRPYLVLRLHPTDTPADYEVARRQFNYVSKGGSALDTVWAADLLVGLTSMLLREGNILGRPVLSVVRENRELDLLPDGPTGISHCLPSEAELRSELHRILEIPAATIQTSDALTFTAVHVIVQFLDQLLEVQAAAT